MITKLLAKIFGTQNDREIKRLQPIVKKINSLEAEMLALSDEQLKDKTGQFKQRIAVGETLDSILPEAFAVVREMARRKLGERHYDVQLIGGIILHEGKIAEMRTGEGKTLVCTLPTYLNALEGKGVHVVTVNDYLAKRDAEWMSPIYNGLGLAVGVIQNNMEDAERKKAYQADITYGTNNEYGFDYLRDNMKFDLNDYVQRDLHYAIVDEVDSILIDEARTPLIISGASERGSNLYQVANKAILHLKKEDYEIDEKARSVNLHESGIDKIEQMLGVGNLYAPENILVLHHATQALRAHTLFKIDVDYVVRENEVLIVDEFTGRILSGRRYSDGLHQALEAKEGVKVERENQTLASITLQNYFRLYKKLAGMTGTAQTEAAEFHKIYKLGVVTVPTNKPMIRNDQADIIFLNREDKYKAIIEDIKQCSQRGQPVLVGTIAIETSEYLSHLLTMNNIPHNVLNAKQHSREAEIVKEAGERGKVTIATNMAGRGTDIKLGAGVLELGGLRIIGTERHESRRIDNQLRGRAGRQGDPGSTKFYLSLDDDLMRIFGGEAVKRRMERLGMLPGESIEHPMISRSIEKAQEKVEKHNFDIRKHLIEYDDVLNQQRIVVYKYRRQILESGENITEMIKDIFGDVVHSLFTIYYPQDQIAPEGLAELCASLEKVTGFEKKTFEAIAQSVKNKGYLEQEIVEFLAKEYESFRTRGDLAIVNEAEKWVLLETVDHAWKLHLQNIDHLKEGIGLRGYGQRNPLLEYKKESFFEFERMMEQIKWDIAQRIFRMKPDEYSASAIQEIEHEKQKALSEIKVGGDQSSIGASQTIKRSSPKLGRNDPCDCGSGKKYKHCCGK
ncbi:MAG: preprotein translocase subunit SecA [Candidatus Babeliales bacterium]